jgi:hypothetical protein
MADINSIEINSLTETDFGNWATPAGQTFVDGTSVHSSVRIVF